MTRESLKKQLEERVEGDKTVYTFDQFEIEISPDEYSDGPDYENCLTRGSEVYYLQRYDHSNRDGFDAFGDRADNYCLDELYYRTTVVEASIELAEKYGVEVGEEIEVNLNETDFYEIWNSETASVELKLYTLRKYLEIDSDESIVFFRANNRYYSEVELTTEETLKDSYYFQDGFVVVPTEEVDDFVLGVEGVNEVYSNGGLQRVVVKEKDSPIEVLYGLWNTEEAFDHGVETVLGAIEEIERCKQLMAA